MTPEMVLTSFLDDIRNEVDRSRRIHGDFSGSLHEAKAIIEEEFDEFWDEVKKKEHNHFKMYEELVQIAAMCAKTAQDCLTGVR